MTDVRAEGSAEGCCGSVLSHELYTGLYEVDEVMNMMVAMLYEVCERGKLWRSDSVMRRRGIGVAGGL